MRITDIEEYSRTRGFRQQTTDRWLRRPEKDRGALLELVQQLKLGENHLRDFLDWLEEISLRDGLPIHAILANGVFGEILSNPRLGRNDKLNRVKEELRRVRFPRLCQIEDRIREKIRALNPSPGIRMTVPRGLEGGVMTVELRVTTHEEFKRFSHELAAIAEHSSLRDIFALLTAGEGHGEL